MMQRLRGLLCSFAGVYGKLELLLSSGYMISWARQCWYTTIKVFLQSRLTDKTESEMRAEISLIDDDYSIVCLPLGHPFDCSGQSLFQSLPSKR